MKLILIFLYVVLAEISFAQHIQDIKKKLYPSFNSVKWGETYNPNAAYEPIDYLKWEANPNATEYDNAFIGYHILDRKLARGLREVRKTMDEAKLKEFNTAHRTWIENRDKACNKKWDSTKLEFGSTMVLDYLYCLSSKTKERLKSLGLDTPLNIALDKQHGYGKYIIGTDFSTLQTELETIKERFPGDVRYRANEKGVIGDTQGNIQLYFYKQKLWLVRIDFSGRYKTSIEQELIKSFGNQYYSYFDPITMVGGCEWKGAQIELYMGYDSELGGVEVSFRGVKEAPPPAKNIDD